MEPLTFVLFGATGDLARRKILPALFLLYLKGVFVSGSEVVAFSRRDWSDQEYRDFVLPVFKDEDQKKVKDFLNIVKYVSGVFEDQRGYEKLKQSIKNDHVILHMAVRPESHIQIIHGLDKAKVKGKVLIEKPFGHDYASADALEKELEKYVSVQNIFRVDHYLGKKGLDEVLRKRKEDVGFSSTLNKEHVESIHFRFIESIDIEGRGEFYDSVGAVSDVGQNHLLSMVSSFFVDIKASKNVCGARAEVLKGLSVIRVIRGQYSGYVEEKNVDRDSKTETYFKVQLASQNENWKGVPMSIEGGKALVEKRSDITIKFKDGSEYVFDIDNPKKPDAYEVILDAAIKGDDSRFVCGDEMMESWRLADEVKKRMGEVELMVYERGWNIK
ncbi:MAG: glucose-6-phosphate 1-dehydrogenase [Candidatus Parcubacteria bacterium]|jgi:glucose-6-phosphate 1-dehydrogenase